MVTPVPEGSTSNHLNWFPIWAGTGAIRCPELSNAALEGSLC